MLLIKNYCIKPQSFEGKKANQESVTTAKLDRGSNPKETAANLYNKLINSTKGDKAFCENLILGDYDEVIDEVGKKLANNPEVRSSFANIASSNIDKELKETSNETVQNVLKSIKNELNKTTGLPDYPVPSTIVFKGLSKKGQNSLKLGFKGEKYIETAKRNALNNKSLSSLSDEQRVAFEAKLAGSDWATEEEFDRDFINALKESLSKRRRARQLIRIRTGMTDANNKLQSKLSFDDNDLNTLFDNAKELKDERAFYKTYSFMNNLHPILGGACIASAAAAAAVPPAFYATAGILALHSLVRSGNSRLYTEGYKKSKLAEFQNTELPAHLLNIKLKRLMLKDKVTPQNIRGIINMTRSIAINPLGDL